ncbi:MAG: hypothetical protein V4710_05320, partial [Verrucomicrobiota bacterium]
MSFTCGYLPDHSIASITWIRLALSHACPYHLPWRTSTMTVSELIDEGRALAKECYVLRDI